MSPTHLLASLILQVPADDDRQVITTAVRALFRDHLAKTREPIYISARWDPYGLNGKDDVVRESLETLLPSLQRDVSRTEMYWKTQRDSEDRRVSSRNAAGLSSVRHRVAAPRGTYNPAPLRALPELIREPRFSFKMPTDTKSRRSYNRCGVSPPAYSADGDLAIVVVNAPWSIHTADHWFVLERHGLGWKVLIEHGIYYC